MLLFWQIHLERKLFAIQAYNLTVPDDRVSRLAFFCFFFQHWCLSANHVLGYDPLVFERLVAFVHDSMRESPCNAETHCVNIWRARAPHIYAFDRRNFFRNVDKTMRIASVVRIKGMKCVGRYSIAFSKAVIYEQHECMLESAYINQ